MTSAKPTRSAVSGRTRTRMLCEGAIMVALAQILSYIKIMELPNGGSLTPAMFPILLFAVRWGLKDGLLSIPILFLAYLLMELLERSSRLNEGLLRRYSRRAGPALGGLLGIVPQCGISGAAATLFSTGSITVGTMLAVFFATSDEMLPILLSSLTESSGISWKTIVLITLSKAALGILLGYLADLLFGRWFVSVVVTESYLSGVLGLGGLFAGLLSNAGIGLLVLLRTNRNWKENAAVVAILYGFSVLAGIAVTLLAG